MMMELLGRRKPLASAAGAERGERRRATVGAVTPRSSGRSRSTGSSSVRYAAAVGELVRTCVRLTECIQV